MFGATNLPALSQQTNLNVVVWMQKIKTGFVFVNITTSFTDTSIANVAAISIGTLTMSSAPVLAYTVDDSRSVSAMFSSSSTVGGFLCNVTVSLPCSSTLNLSYFFTCINIETFLPSLVIRTRSSQSVDC